MSSFYQDKIMNHFLAGQIRSLDVDDDLKHFIEVVAISLDEFSSDISLLSDIWDLDKCPKRFLPYIAQMIGWSFGDSDTEQEQRNQLRLAIPSTSYKAA